MVSAEPDPGPSLGLEIFCSGWEGSESAEVDGSRDAVDHFIHDSRGNSVILEAEPSFRRLFIVIDRLCHPRVVKREGLPILDFLGRRGGRKFDYRERQTNHPSLR